MGLRSRYTLCWRGSDWSRCCEKGRGQRTWHWDLALLSCLPQVGRFAAALPAVRPSECQTSCSYDCLVHHSTLTRICLATWYAAAFGVLHTTHPIPLCLQFTNILHKPLSPP